MQGQFLSQDPVFLALGNPNQVRQLASQNQKQFLSDPQQLNSYGYAGDNPIVNKDPSGNQFCELGCTDLVVYPITAYYAWPIVAGIAGATAYVTTNTLLRTPNSAKYGPYPGPGMDYQTYQLATQNSYRLDPDPNGNWKGTIAALAGSLTLLKWLTDNANGGTDGPTNLDWIYAIYQGIRGTSPLAPASNGISGSGSNSGSGAQSKATTYISAYPTQSKSSTLPLPSGSGYGSPGSVYTNYIAPNAHSACGTLCR